VITALDTNILLDVLLPDPTYGADSLRNLEEAAQRGDVIICGPVYAELAAQFADAGDLDRFLSSVGVAVRDAGSEALWAAGRAWRGYSRRRPRGIICPRCSAPQDVVCERCGHGLDPRQHIVTDFIIGAHALVHADRLLTRDRGYYRSYFPRLELE